MKKVCLNPECLKRFIRKSGRQLFCSAKCRRKIEHIPYITKYPEKKKERMDKLFEWYKENEAHWKLSLSKRKRAEVKGKTAKVYPSWLSPLPKERRAQ